MKTLTMLGALAAITLGGCADLLNGGRDQVQTSSASDTVYVLISANDDSYASYGRNGSEQDRNFGRSGQLVVANGPLGNKESYINFALPQFPQGTEVLKAKLELFHSGKNEDGTPDDIVINVGAVTNERWSSGTITWANRPDRGGMPPAHYALFLRSQTWSGTEDIAGTAQAMIDNADANYGFVFSLPEHFFAQQIEKGFYSNNETRRRVNNRVVAPRLLMKVVMPRGTTSTLPLPAGAIEPGGVMELLTASGRSNEWPADWDVSPDH